MLIDENAKIFRIEFWFIPIKEFIEIKVIKKIKFLLKIKYDIIIIGEIFCHVNINKQVIQFNPSINEGIHKWKGISLNFINNGIIKIKLKLLNIKNIDLLIKKINNKIEAKAWIIKYFIVDSIEYNENLKFIIGIIENKFNSNPIHIDNQLEVEIEIKDLKIIKLININFVKFKLIRKKNLIYIWSMNPKA